MICDLWNFVFLVAQKLGLLQSTPLTRISSPRFRGYCSWRMALGVHLRLMALTGCPTCISASGFAKELSRERFWKVFSKSSLHKTFWIEKVIFYKRVEAQIGFWRKGCFSKELLKFSQTKFQNSFWIHFCFCNPRFLESKF